MNVITFLVPRTFIYLAMIVLSFVLVSCAKKDISMVPKTHSQALFYASKGSDSYQKGCTKLALDYFFKAYELYSVTDNQTGMADMLNNIGNVYRVSGEYAVSKVFYSEASRIFSDNSNFYKLMISNSNIAAVCMDMSDYTAAQQYLTKAEEISTTNNYDYLPLKTNRLHLLLKINKPDEAGKLITAESNYTISDKYLSSFYYVKGLYYLNANNYQKAIDYVDKALTIDKQNEHFNSIGEDLLCLGNIYLKMGNPEPAYRFYDRSYNIFILIHNHPKSEIARSYKNRISDIFPGFIPDTTISNYFSEKWKKNIFHASPCD